MKQRRATELQMLQPVTEKSVGFITDRPGCHSCPKWRRVNAATGRSLATGERHGWLTSYAYVCPDHPEFDAASAP